MIGFLHNHKILKLFIIMIIILTAIAFMVFLYLIANPVFGGKASKADELEYVKRADNYKDGCFHNDNSFKIIWDGNDTDTKTLSYKGREPSSPLPVKTPDISTRPDISEAKITWFGHSSLLLQIHGMNILIDPVFSERCSPVSFAGPKRFSKAIESFDALPDIDILIISHDHYDHLDYKTIKELKSRVKEYIVPLGVENHLERWGVENKKIRTMAWWEEITIDGLTIGCTPALHYSSRSLDDRSATLWASWVFIDEYIKIFESGDTGYGSHFEKIHNKYGDFDIVLTDCAQYNQKWRQTHMFPEESVMAVKTLGAKTAIPIHWGAFSLSDHAWDDPVSRFVKAADENGLNVMTPYIGETAELKSPEKYTVRWWEDIK